LKQTVLSAINHKSTGKLPYNVELTCEKRKTLCDELGIAESEYFLWAGNHIEKADYNFGGYISPGYYKDGFGVVWNRTGIDKDIGVVSEYLVTEENYKDYRAPYIDAAYIKQVTQSLLGSKLDTLRLGKISMTLFERAWSLRGMENLLEDFYLNPEIVEHILDALLEHNLKIIDIALEYEIDGFYFGDDFGTQISLIMSPEIWRKFIKPRYKTMFDRIKSKGRITALHSCGNINGLLGDLIDIGLDVYQTVQPEIYDLKQLKEEFGRYLCFWGAISTQQLLPYATQEELISTVLNTIDILSKDGGYIASPTHQVTPDISNESVLTLIELLRSINA